MLRKGKINSNNTKSYIILLCSILIIFFLLTINCLLLKLFYLEMTKCYLFIWVF